MDHQVLGKMEWSAIVMMLLTVALVVSCSEGRAEAEKEPIVFSDLNWTSAQFQNRVAQYIVEKGYGYPTDVVFGATLPELISEVVEIEKAQVRERAYPPGITNRR